MLSLEEYAAKHNYTILEQYTTLGEERGSNRRAIVLTPTGERHYLYFDSSHRRLKNCSNCRKSYKEHDPLIGCMFNGFRQRGWRNTTLDNRRSKQKREEEVIKYEDINATMHASYKLIEEFVDENTGASNVES